MLKKLAMPMFILVLSFSTIISYTVVQPVFAQDDFVDEYYVDTDETTDTDSFDDSFAEPYDETYIYDETADSLDEYTYDYEYSTKTQELTEEEAAAFLTAFAGMGALFFGVIACLGLSGYIYGSLSLATIGKKLEVDGSWMAWVPFINFFYMVKLAELDIWMGILFFIPVVNFVMVIYTWMKISERRGFPSWLAFLLLVPVVNIFIPGYIAWAGPKAAEADLSPM